MDAVPDSMGIRNQLFIGGEFVDAAAGGVIEVLNPHDNSVITEVAEARAEDTGLCSVFPQRWGWLRTRAQTHGFERLTSNGRVEPNPGPDSGLIARIWDGPTKSLAGSAGRLPWPARGDLSTPH